MIEQPNIFDLGIEDNHYDYEKYFKPGTKIKLFEAFAGVGCQAMALKKLGIAYESVGISEIDKYAINSYNAIHGETKNYGDICKMTEIPPCDIFTWSFPCTDLSKAGKQKGLNGTRSGLVYEVLRLLHATENKPKVLIMENVVDLVQEKFKAEFYEIQKEIESLGYKNYTTTLNAKHHGVAQNRDRVFMVSLLGGGRYEFPPRERLEKRLKDYLEKNVAEKYYLSKKMTKYLTLESDKWTGNNGDSIVNKSIASCITTREGNTRADSSTYVSRDLPYDFNIKILEATKQGYALAEDGDDIGVVVNGNYSPSNHNVIIDIKSQGKYSAKPNSEIAPTQYAQEHYGIIENNLRIRKLTPKECWRLMGINDEDFEKAAKVCSNAQLYKQAGNGIVVDVFAGILKGLI